MTLGDILKAKRKKCGLAISDVEDRLEITNLSRYENDLAEPGMKPMLRLMLFYNITLGDIEDAILAA